MNNIESPESLLAWVLASVAAIIGTMALVIKVLFSILEKYYSTSITELQREVADHRLRLEKCEEDREQLHQSVANLSREVGQCEDRQK